MKRERFNNKWHDYCTFCDMFKELTWIVIQGIITSVTIQPMTDWRVTTDTHKCTFIKPVMLSTKKNIINKYHSNEENKNKNKINYNKFDLFNLLKKMTIEEINSVGW